MSYTERVRELVFESPSGIKYTAEFDSLTRTGGKKAPVTEFPGQDLGAVQDLGNSTPTFPVTCYITGTDYDTASDLFWAALHETGPGMLYHPRWGDIKVLAIPGSQTEEFVNGCGRAIFEITFIKAGETQFNYPTPKTDSITEVGSNVDDTATEVTEAMSTSLDDAGSLSSLAASIGDALDIIVSSFDGISDLTDDIKESIENTVSEITSTIDDLVSAPANLMTSLLVLYRYPSEVAADVTEMIEAYETIYDDLIDGFKETTEDYGEDLGLINCAHAYTIGIALAEAAVNADIPTRTAAAEAIESLDDFVQGLRDDIETMESSGDFVVDVSLQISVEKAITSAISGLISSSLGLPSERTMILSRNVDPITLCYELYGDTDYLDDFLDYNGLQGNDRLIVPRGTEVRWYIDE